MLKTGKLDSSEPILVLQIALRQKPSGAQTPGKYARESLGDILSASQVENLLEM